MADLYLRPALLGPVLCGLVGLALLILVVGLITDRVPVTHLEFRGAAGACQVFEERPTGRTVIICPPVEGRRL